MPHKSWAFIVVLAVALVVPARSKDATHQMLARAQSAFAGTTVVNDIELTGTATRSAGSTHETGPIVLIANSAGRARHVHTIGSAQRVEYYSGHAEDADCAWEKGTGPPRSPPLTCERKKVLVEGTESESADGGEDGLRPHTDWREIETDFGGRVRASLNFSVGGKNPQFFFSSGQRRAAGLAFLLAIHLSRPWSSFNTLLLDDPVQHIDDYRALNLVEVLAAIRRTGRQVIVAVEDPALADVLCRRLRST